MEQIEALTPTQLHELELYKKVTEGKPINQALTLEDLTSLKELSEAIPQLERDAEDIYNQIQQKALEIQELEQQISELKSQIDPKIRFLKESPTEPTTQPKTVNNHTVKEEYAAITPEAILQTLEGSYGMGNSEIAKKLNLEGTKGQQNKIYVTCKKLEDEGKLINKNRMWVIK